MASAAFSPVTVPPHYDAMKKMVVRVPPGEPIPELRSPAIARALAMAIIGTSVSTGCAPVVQLTDIVQFAPQPVQSLAVVEMLRAIRRKTALTWDNLASMLDVTRRSLHHWANGQTVSAENEHNVRVLHERVLKFGAEPAFVARTKILQEYGIAQAPAGASGRSEPFLVADQTPIAAKVSVSRSPRTRIR